MSELKNNGEDMTILQVTREDLSDIKKEMVNGFNTLTVKLDGMQGQYTNLMVEQVGMKKDIEALQIQSDNFSSMIKAIIGTIVTAILTAVLALVLKN